MPTQRVNLDALIRREHFETQNQNKLTTTVDNADRLKVVELEQQSLMFKWLRKPDFQRTTAYWTPQKVAGFIRSFLAGDLIPALILWQSESSGSIFVIDGAHRISALVAWVHDDYGDRGLSLPFFENRVPKEQKDAADETRRIIALTVGSYVEIKHGTNLDSERTRFSGNLAAGGIALQWVRGDASSAYRSFHTINTEQTPLGELEKRLIRDRRGANAIATRSLVSAGTGQFSRSTFPPENQDEIKKIAAEIYEDLFVPPLETPIKTLDLPVAGRSYSSDSVEMILNFIEFVNRKEVQREKPVRAKRQPLDNLAPTVQDDPDGTHTINFLRNVRKASSLIAGNKPKSLGLHPAVYFYSATGNFQPAAFLAAVAFVQGFEDRRELARFTMHRAKFETLLLTFKHFINEIVKRRGAGERSIGAIAKLYQYAFDGIASGKSEAEIFPAIASDPVLSFLQPIIDDDKGSRKAFTSERKSAVFLREAISSAVRCKVCDARVPKNSISIDHTERVADGGAGVVENGQVTHPYCNTGYKESLHAARNQTGM